MQSLLVLALVALVQANPILLARQAVTSDISPTASPPPGCSPTVGYKFGIVVHTMTPSGVAKRQATQIADGQVQAASQIADGQVQQPVSQIADGQIQAAVTPAPAPSPTHMTVAMVSMIHDGQIQAAVVPTVMQISDGQLQAPKPTPGPAVSEMSDGQPIASSGPAVAEMTDGQPIASSVAASSAASPSETGTCSGLAISIDNGKLTDQSGRTGYIASNFQFQFDKPPQAGAIYTSGFSVCNNGSLGFGGTNVFYQCLSGDFYNLYDRSWAAQCRPVIIETFDKQC